MDTASEFVKRHKESFHEWISMLCDLSNIPGYHDSRPAKGDGAEVMPAQKEK